MSASATSAIGAPAPLPPGFCLCLAGPTASGKTLTALAIVSALAAQRTVEIVSVDSALVYRGMDIGTAKPGAAERAQATHHLIDIVDPADHYSAARFVADATRLIGEIGARGALPLLVGGTMLYFKALFEGLDTMPVADAALRDRLTARAGVEGWPALHAELALVDPVTAARLAPRDGQRIQRALEVYLLSGMPLSVWHTRRGDAVGPKPMQPPMQPPMPMSMPMPTPTKTNTPMPMPSPLIALEPLDRTWLHARIGARFDAMLAAGLVDEVLALRARGDLHAELPSMRCVGYRQTWRALDRGSLDGLAEQGAAATRQLAKRQLTWLRAMPARHVVACDGPDAVERAVELAKTLLGAATSTAPTIATAVFRAAFGASS